MKLFKNNSGFTLLEVASMIVIIAFIISATFVAFTSVRQKNRDTLRVTDVTQLQNALASYYRDNNAYPAAITPGEVLTVGGITYMTDVPANRVPTNDGSCPSNPQYLYTQDGSGASYHIAFCLGTETSSLSAGTHYATPAGMY
jgi:type II secretory pathway pseudopilin PulG